MRKSGLRLTGSTSLLNVLKMNARALSDIRRKLQVLDYAKEIRMFQRPAVTSTSPGKAIINGNATMSSKARRRSRTANAFVCPL